MSVATGTRTLRVRAEGAALVAALGVMFAINLQFWAIDAAPLIDWPNHLARHILQCGAPGSEFLRRYYQYELALVPNLTSDLIHTLGLACRDPLLTQKVLIQLSSFGVVVSTVILYRAIWGSYSVWPLISGLIMHHMAWAYGFENFVLAVPPTLLILAAWFALSERSAVLRLLTLWPLATGLYVLHIYAFAFLLLVVATLELDRHVTERARAGALKSALVTLALLALIAAFPAAHTLVSIQASPEIEATQLVHGGIDTLLMTLVSPFAGFSDPTRSTSALGAAVAVMLAFCLIAVGLRSQGTLTTIDPRVRKILPILLLAVLIAPNNFFAVHLSNIRLPVLTLALLIAATRVRMPARTVWTFAAVVLIVVAAKSSWITGQWRHYERQVAELRAAAEFLTPDDRFLHLRQGSTGAIVLHSHTPTYVLMDQGSYWKGIFTGGNSLSPRPDYATRDHTQPFPIDWRLLGPDYRQFSVFAEGGRLHEWSSFYTHALLVFDPAGGRPDATAIGPVVASGSFFDFYRIAPLEEQVWP